MEEMSDFLPNFFISFLVVVGVGPAFEGVATADVTALRTTEGFFRVGGRMTSGWGKRIASS